MKIKDKYAFTNAQVWAEAARCYKCEASWRAAMMRLRKAYGL